MFCRKIALWIVISQLIGCGSGSPDEAPAPPAASPAPAPTSGGGGTYVHFEGIWQGTITPDDTMTSGTAIVLVNGWGQFRLFAHDLQFVGSPRRTLSELEGNLIGFRSHGSTWSDGTRISPFMISGSIYKYDFIDAAYAGDAGSGSPGLAWVRDIYSADIDSINGSWTLIDDNQYRVATFNLDVTSKWETRISGNHSNGCIYSGPAESWTSSNSCDIWELNISNCPSIAGIQVNGYYSGSAALVDVADDGADVPALVVALGNDQNQVTHFLYRP